MTFSSMLLFEVCASSFSSSEGRHTQDLRLQLGHKCMTGSMKDVSDPGPAGFGDVHGLF